MYFVGKEDILIEAQLNKEQKLHTSPTISTPKPILAPERANLVGRAHGWWDTCVFVYTCGSYMYLNEGRHVLEV